MAFDNQKVLDYSGPKVIVSKKFNAGSKNSVMRLKQLYFDPIEELVTKYRNLESEVAYQERLRSREVVELTPSGKERAYRAEVHHSLIDKQIKIAEALLRYRYGRVPEHQFNDDLPAMPLIVNTTKKGEQYVINEDNPIVDIEEDDSE